MKTCRVCREIKESSEFRKKRNICKECEKQYHIEYRKTKDGLINSIYDNQKRTSKKRGHQHPTYTKEELKKWLFKQDLFHELYDLWVLSSYNKYQKPSIDRLDNSKGYSFYNIRLVTWRDNDNQAHEDIKTKKLKNSGLLNGGHKAVLQFDLKGNFIAEYMSVREAERQTKTNAPHISAVCKGKRKTAGGYIWKYKERGI